MSLAAQTAWGGGAGAMGGYVPQPQFKAQQPQQPAGGSSSSAFRTKQVTSVSSDDRGVLVGDACCTLSFDHGRKCIDIATWSEQRSRCRQLESQSAVVQLTEQGAKSVASASGAAAAFARHPLAELPEGIDILGSDASSAGDPIRLLDCLEVDKKIARHGVDFDPAPLLAHLVVRSVKAGMAAEGMGSAAAGAEGAAASKKAAAKAGHLGNNTVTLVLPVSYTYAQQAGAMKAVHSAGYTLRNVFHRGLATVATHVMESRDVLCLEAVAEGKSDDFAVLYVHVDPHSGALEAALIGCESHTPAGKQKKDRVVDRLYCLATADEGTPKAGKAADAARVLGGLLSGPGAGMVLQAVVMVGSASLGGVSALAGVPVISADAGDAVKGGCYLSAAELDSSKQYINVDNKWVVAYQLPIADGFLPFDIGMCVSSAEGSAATTPVETTFRAGTRIQKREMGVVRPRTGNEPLLVRRQKSGDRI